MPFVFVVTVVGSATAAAARLRFLPASRDDHRRPPSEFSCKLLLLFGVSRTILFVFSQVDGVVMMKNQSINPVMVLMLLLCVWGTMRERFCCCSDESVSRMSRILGNCFVSFTTTYYVVATVARVSLESSKMLMEEWDGLPLAVKGTSMSTTHPS